MSAELKYQPHVNAALGFKAAGMWRICRMNIYVGNLTYSVTDNDLQDAFAAHGAVDRAKVILDRETGRSRGFGFVEMANDDEGNSAIEAMNGYELDGRALNVNEARPRT